MLLSSPSWTAQAVIPQKLVQETALLRPRTLISCMPKAQPGCMQALHAALGPSYIHNLHFLPVLNPLSALHLL